MMQRSAVVKIKAVVFCAGQYMDYTLSSYLLLSVAPSLLVSLPFVLFSEPHMQFLQLTFFVCLCVILFFSLFVHNCNNSLLLVSAVRSEGA